MDARKLMDLLDSWKSEDNPCPGDILLDAVAEFGINTEELIAFCGEGVLSSYRRHFVGVNGCGACFQLIDRQTCIACAYLINQLRMQIH